MLQSGKIQIVEGSHDSMSKSGMRQFFEDLQAERSQRYTGKNPCYSGVLPRYDQRNPEDVQLDIERDAKWERQRQARARKAINDFIKESARYFDEHETFVGMPLTKTEIAAYTGRRS